MKKQTMDEIKKKYRIQAEEIVNRSMKSEVHNYPKDGEETGEFYEPDEEYKEYVSDLFESEEFDTVISKLFTTCIYLNLHEPSLTIPIQPAATRTFDYCSLRKKEVYVVDGFVKEGAECIVVLPPVMRNNFPFNGIKPSILILQSEFVTEKV